jgi:hypothetical protein
MTTQPDNQTAEKDVLPMFHAGRVRRCEKCGGTDWRTNARGRVTCRDCEKAHKRERKDRRHRERGDRCGCGTDATSLNPAEVVVHNWGGGACHIVPVKRAIPAGKTGGEQ